jgi:Tfp pilus assembly protein PilF
MKKLSTVVLTSILAVVLLFNFVGCEKLKISNLKANHHLKKANDHYRKDKFKKAIEEYETALEYNPKLAQTYFYVGTAYALLFKPGKDTEKNKVYGDEALKYLLKAKEVEPEKNQEKVILALGDIYDKMENFEEAEKYYLQILERAPDRPDTYYILADFYSKYGKFMEAEGMYEKRIQLDPENPDGYFYYANFLQNRRKFDMALKYHQKRINAMVDPEIEKIQMEVDKLGQTLDQIGKIQDFMEQLKKNRRVDKEEKDRLLAEKTEQLAQLGNPEELKKQMDEKTEALKAKYDQMDEIIKGLPEEKIKAVSRAYYTIGVVCWNKSYQTQTDMMGAEERLLYVKKGFEALNKATDLDLDFADPWAYKRLLYLEQIKAEPLKRDEYMRKHEEMGEKFLKLRKKQIQREEYMRQLEEVGREGGEE